MKQWLPSLKEAEELERTADIEEFFKLALFEVSYTLSRAQSRSFRPHKRLLNHLLVELPDVLGLLPK
jgi:hypothetical protein